MKINTISINDADYPVRLRAIPDAPKRLYVSGRLPNTPGPWVAVVGSRRPTAYGRTVTEQLVGRLADSCVIVSGLALGIDSIAHQACLAAGGQTVAILPSDLANPYPASHRQLARQIVAGGGALISEADRRPKPARWDFLSRNRLISGLADAIIVTEAGLRSGTMNTVAHALNQGRDVYAVPGPITSPLSAGCNRLIAQGAQPITDIDQFIDELLPGNNEQRVISSAEPAEQAILDALRSGLSDGEELLTHSRLDADHYQRTMTILEIKGLIHSIGANQWRL